MNHSTSLVQLLLGILLIVTGRHFNFYLSFWPVCFILYVHHLDLSFVVSQLDTLGCKLSNSPV